MFRTAGEVVALTRQLSFVESENSRLIWQVTALEKEMRSERASHLKDLRKYCDQISKQSGLSMKFEERLPAVAPEPLPLTAYQEMQVDDLARQMIEQAESMNDPVPSWEQAKIQVKNDLSTYQKDGLVS